MILITGHKGFVGPVLTKRLTEKGYQWKGFDIGLFEKEINPKDIRDITINDFQNVDTVMHLACLTLDPLFKLDVKLSEKINYEETIRIAKLAKAAGVKKFIFFSTCSIYGKTQNPGDVVSEESTPYPVNVYGTSKLASEKELLQLEDQNFLPICMRFCTSYGVSPNLRSDLIINTLMGQGFFNKKITLTDDTLWRPFVHVEDMVTAVIGVLEKDSFQHRIYNIGQNKENYQMKDMAQVIKDTLQDLEVEVLGKVGADTRSYQVDFSRFQSEFGNILNWDIKRGCQQIYDWLKEGHVRSLSEYLDAPYERITGVRKLMDEGKLDANLHVIN